MVKKEDINKPILIMKANEAPERLYLSKNIYSTFLYQVPDPDDETAVEYIQTNVFIEKACKAYCKMCKMPNCNSDECKFINEFRNHMEV